MSGLSQKGVVDARMILDRCQDHSRRFDQLMETYERIYLLMQRLIGAERVQPGQQVSVVGDTLPLYLEVIECHRYTTFLRLTYLFLDQDGNSADPDAVIRLYHDAESAEVTYCHPGKSVAELTRPWLPARDLFQRRWEINRFLLKWLEYLVDQGHNPDTFVVSNRALPEVNSARSGVGVVS